MGLIEALNERRKADVLSLELVQGSKGSGQSRGVGDVAAQKRQDLDKDVDDDGRAAPGGGGVGNAL